MRAIKASVVGAAFLFLGGPACMRAAETGYVLEARFTEPPSFVLRIPEQDTPRIGAAMLTLRRSEKYPSGMGWFVAHGETKFGRDGTYRILKNPFVLRERKDGWQIAYIAPVRGPKLIRARADGEIETVLETPGGSEQVELIDSWRPLTLRLTLLKPEANALRSYLPKEGLERFIAESLDIQSLPSELLPPHSPKARTFADLGLAPEGYTAEAKPGLIQLWPVSSLNDQWNLSLYVLGTHENRGPKVRGRGDFDEDGIEDIEVCLSAWSFTPMTEGEGKHFHESRLLLLTRLGPNEPLISRTFGDGECPWDPNDVPR